MKKTKKLAKAHQLVGDAVGKAGVTRRKRHRIFFLNFGKLILDLAKMSFASLVLGIILKGEIPQETLLNAGIIVTGAGTLFGLILIAFFEEK